MTKKELSPFEQGVVVTLYALIASLKRQGSVDAQELAKLADFFISNPSVSGEEAIAAYEWPIAALRADPTSIAEFLRDFQKTN